jgi:anti-anti-sigma factor
VRGAATPTRRVVLDAEGIGHVDSAGLAALGDVAEALRRAGIELAVARMETPVETTLRDAGLVRAIGESRFHGTVRQAIRAP